MKSEWSEAKLGDVVVFHYGKSLTASKRIEGDVPVYSSAGITGRHNKALVNSRGLVIGRKGNVGTVYKSNVPFFTIDTAYYALPNDEVYDFEFMYFLLLSIGLDTLNEDSAVPGLNRNTAYSQEIRLPPLPTQKTIAHILSTLDDKIELNRKMNETLESMAQAIFKSWFVDFDPVHAKAGVNSEDELDKAAKDLGISREVLDLFPSEFEESELGLIPKGWEVKELGDFFPVITGKKNANIATHDGKYIFFTCSQEASKTDVFSFDAAAILLAGNGDFNVKWYRGKFEAYQRTYVLIPRDPEYLSFLYFLISYKLNDITLGSLGSVIKFITKGMIENYEIVAPNETILKDIVDTFSNINFKIEGNLEQIQTLQKTIDTLLPKLLSGELDVSNLNFGLTDD
jgi:type I restriction enzyme, S subunit